MQTEEKTALIVKTLSTRFVSFNVLYGVPAAGKLSVGDGVSAAAKFASRGTKRIVTVTIKYVMYSMLTSR